MNRIANVLVKDLGLKSGERVLLRSANNPQFVAAYLAVMKAGGIAVATMPLLRAKEISFPINKARISLRPVRSPAGGGYGEGQGAGARLAAHRLFQQP